MNDSQSLGSPIERWALVDAEPGKTAKMVGRDSGDFVLNEDHRARVEELRQELSERWQQVDSLQQLLDEIVVAEGSFSLMPPDLPEAVRELRARVEELERERDEALDRLRPWLWFAHWSLPHRGQELPTPTAARRYVYWLGRKVSFVDRALSQVESLIERGASSRPADVEAAYRQVLDAYLLLEELDGELPAEEVEAMSTHANELDKARKERDEAREQLGVAREALQEYACEGRGKCSAAPDANGPCMDELRDGHCGEAAFDALAKLQAGEEGSDER